MTDRCDAAEAIPFEQRIGCSIDEAVTASGRSRSQIYKDIKAGKLEYRKNGTRTIILVKSLIALVTAN